MASEQSKDVAAGETFAGLMVAVFLDVYRSAPTAPGPDAAPERFELIALAVTGAHGAPTVRRMVNAHTALDWFEALTDGEQEELARRLDLAGRIVVDEEQRRIASAARAA